MIDLGISIIFIIYIFHFTISNIIYILSVVFSCQASYLGCGAGEGDRCGEIITLVATQNLG